ARDGVRAGARLLIAAGGDGTASEVVAGVLGAGLGGAADIAFLPLGTGGDLVRALGAGEPATSGARKRSEASALDDTIARIASGKARRIDAGRIAFTARDGRALETYFVNIASIGVSGLVTQLVNEAPKIFGGRVSFFVGTLRAIARWQPAPVTLRVDGAVVHEGPLHLATVANGRYFGGGMHVAPGARFDDGVFDVVVIRGEGGKGKLLRNFPRLYAASHLRLDEVTQHRGALVEAESAAPVPIEIDGEPLGRLAARFECLPGAIGLRGIDA
ncbi:MAG: diacylglycerol kinase, partial [Proteobacteria bacterium]